MTQIQNYRCISITPKPGVSEIVYCLFENSRETCRSCVRSITHTAFRSSLAVVLLIVSMAVYAQEAHYPVNKNWRSIAIKGYDPVAYFTEGKAVKGKSKFEYKWQDARWRFATAKHLELFSENPETYAPRFGGHCAEGLSLGRVASIDPQAWLIVEGALYLNYSLEARDEMARHPEETIGKADQFWQKIDELISDL